MGNVSVNLPSDGETADVADYNTPINTIVNEMNGNLDNSNIASDAAIAGSKLADGSVTSEKLSSTVAFSARVGSTQSVNNITITLVDFDTELFDLGSNYNTTSKQFTAPYDGVYEFSFFVRTDGTLADGTEMLSYLYVNGSNVTRLSRSAGSADKQTITHPATILSLSAGDVVDARIYHNHGSARNFAATATESLFSGKLIGRTN